MAVTPPAESDGATPHEELRRECVRWALVISGPTMSHDDLFALADRFHSFIRGEGQHSHETIMRPRARTRQMKIGHDGTPHVTIDRPACPAVGRFGIVVAIGIGFIVGKAAAGIIWLLVQ